MVPVVVPAYYYFPMEEGSYVCRNEYFFGTELLVQPMVHPTDPETGYTTENHGYPRETGMILIMEKYIMVERKDVMEQ